MLSLVPHLSAAVTITNTAVLASGTTVGGTSPDSISVSPAGIWVAYTNGADSTGKSGSSTVVEYDTAGTVLSQQTFAGYVDGLKYDAERDLVWVLVNQDGNSVVTILDHLGNMTTPAITVPSSTRGFDDIVFLNGGIYMSYTNPAAPTDPTLLYLTSFNPLTFATVLTMGSTGTDLAQQKAGLPTVQNDPDSIKVTPFGGIMLTSGDDGSITFVHDLANFNRSISFITVLDPTSGTNVKGLDDVVFATTPSGSFYIADTGNNRVLRVDVTGLSPNTLFASVGSINAVAGIDMKTGKATPFITTAAGTALKAPHGLEFVPTFTSLFQ